MKTICVASTHVKKNYTLQNGLYRTRSTHMRERFAAE